MSEEKLREAIHALLNVLPSSGYWAKLEDDESWKWCWDELSDDAQNHVIAAGKKAEETLGYGKRGLKSRFT